MNKVSLPLTPDVMVEFFKDKSVIFEIDVDASISNINEVSMMRYLANLGITCNVDRVTDELLLQFMTIKETCNIQNLNVVHANILHLAKYGEVLYEETLSDFSVDQMKAFIQDNMDVVVTQIMFLDSMLLYFLTRDENNFDKSTIQNTNDTMIEGIGFNILKLLEITDFLLLYSRDVPNVEDQTYYSRYFDEYMFNGKNLYYHIATNAYFGLVARLTQGYEDADIKEEMNHLYSELVSSIAKHENVHSD